MSRALLYLMRIVLSFVLFQFSHPKLRRPKLRSLIVQRSADNGCGGKSAASGDVQWFDSGIKLYPDRIRLLVHLLPGISAAAFKPALQQT